MICAPESVTVGGQTSPLSPLAPVFVPHAHSATKTKSAVPLVPVLLNPFAAPDDPLISFDRIAKEPESIQQACLTQNSPAVNVKTARSSIAKRPSSMPKTLVGNQQQASGDHMGQHNQCRPATPYCSTDNGVSSEVHGSPVAPCENEDEDHESGDKQVTTARSQTLLVGQSFVLERPAPCCPCQAGMLSRTKSQRTEM